MRVLALPWDSLHFKIICMPFLYVIRVSNLSRFVTNTQTTQAMKEKFKNVQLMAVI